MQKQCTLCGAPFTLTAPRQTYCSDPCRRAARREYIAATMRSRRNGQVHPPVAKRPHSNRVDIICEVCGDTTSKPASQAKAPHQYCGTACRNKAQERPGGPKSPDNAATYRRRHPEKYQAKRAVRTAIRRGKLIRLPCEVCGASPADAHHHLGYAEEHHLDVRWLCRPHHLALHKGPRPRYS